MKKIDQSTWLQTEFNDLKRRRGRPSLQGKAKQFKTVGLSKEQWEWLNLWMPGASPTAQLEELIERALKFWPAGPTKFR